MTKNEMNPSVEKFLLWRSNLFQGLKARKETIIELLDALSSNQQAHSVVELSLNPLFRRDYNSLYRGIQEFLPTQTDPNYTKQIETLFSAVSRTIPTTTGERVPSKNKGVNQGNQQLEKIWKSSSFSDKLAVLVADSDYSQREFIGEQVEHKDVVTITRVRSDRVFYRQFIPDPNQAKTSGHPRWYGDKFALKDDQTWHDPDEISQDSFTTKKGL
jgi:hypothetical protein